jgi:hypothetical protein
MNKAKVIKLAKTEVGYVEGKSNFNKFARVAVMLIISRGAILS